MISLPTCAQDALRAGALNIDLVAEQASRMFTGAPSSGVGAELESDGHVPGGTGDDQLMEVAVADDQVPQPAAIDVVALGSPG